MVNILKKNFCFSIIPRIIKSDIIPHMNVSRKVSTTTVLFDKIESKPKSKVTTFTQEDLNRLNKVKIQEIQEDIKQTEIDEKIAKGANQLLKALVFGFLSATVATIAYGAYDPTFRKQLKVTYPWAYAALDLALGKEQEEDSILDEKEIAKKASIFKE